MICFWNTAKRMVGGMMEYSTARIMSIWFVLIDVWNRTLERINRALEKGKSLDELDLPFDFERRPSKPAPEHGHDKVQPRTENNAALI